MSHHRCLVVLLLASVLSLPLLGQDVPDLSQALEYKIAWSMEVNHSIGSLSFTPNFGEHQGLDVVTTSMGGIPRTWLTRPRLDTTNMFDWHGILTPSYLLPLDYDGIPPYEYVNYHGVIWRCNDGESPFPLTPIDTAAWGTCTGTPSFSGDVNEDGYLDCVTGGNGQIGRVIMGGPMSGKGCQRVETVPANIHFPGGENDCYAYYRSSTSGWRVLQFEHDPGKTYGQLQLYDVQVRREADSVAVTFVPLGVFDGTGRSGDIAIGDPVVVVDTLNGKDWLLLRHRLDLPEKTIVLQRFDLTDGQITPLEWIPMASGAVSYGYTFGTERPVIVYGAYGFGRFHVCYADNPLKPFAIINAKITDQFESWVAINDQTGDGKPDILLVDGRTSSSTLRLISLDPSITGVPENAAAAGFTARLAGNDLLVTLAAPGLVTADVVTLRGQVLAAMPPVPGTAGINHMDLGTVLEGLASGMYYLRLRTGEGVLTIPLMR